MKWLWKHIAQIRVDQGMVSVRIRGLVKAHVVRLPANLDETAMKLPDGRWLSMADLERMVA